MTQDQGCARSAQEGWLPIVTEAEKIRERIAELEIIQRALDEATEALELFPRPIRKTDDECD